MKVALERSRNARKQSWFNSTTSGGPDSCVVEMGKMFLFGSVVILSPAWNIRTL